MTSTQTAGPQPTSGTPAERPRATSPRAVLSRSRVWYGTWVLVWLAVLVVGLLLPSALIDEYYMRIIARGASLGLLALSIGWLLRQTGLLSFGHAGFYAAGAYLAGISVTRWELSTAEAVLIGVGGAALLGLLAGLIIVRTSGITFAMLTLAIGQIVYVAATNSRSFTNGYDGLIVTFPGNLFGVPASDLGKPGTAWTFIWCTILGVIAVLWVVSRLPYGRRLAAIRENEERVRFLGISTLLPRIGALTISAAVAGLAGVLHALTAGLVTPDDAAWTTSGLALIVAVIGGVGALTGPVGAGIAFILLESSLASTSHFELITGLVLIAVVIAAPGGAAGLVGRGVLAAKRRLGRGGNHAS